MKKISIYILTALFFYTLKLNAANFSSVDEVINNAISSRYFPGAQLIVGNKDNILYQKNYGSFTYEDPLKMVDNSTMFDIASLTKVTATTTAIMKLYDDGKINLDDRVAYYIPEFGVNGKESITILNLLLHNSGLKAWVPFYQFTTGREGALKIIYDIQLDYPTGTQTLYSDLNAILLGEVVERVTDMTLDEYCKQNIFEPLGMYGTKYNPAASDKEYIMPTENDTYWRHKQLIGEVHDEAASILGGVSGNAGLFSTANDLYALVKMLMNKGKFIDKSSSSLREAQFVSPAAIDMFTSRYTNTAYSNTRALGWETKPIPTSYRIPCGENISENCFGHTGYTGTSIWCDKDRGIAVILLTNRVYPSRDNNGIREIRAEVHNRVFDITDKMN
jgi:CubicO group peptidase (beta-lactamase class C family)